MKMSVSQPDSGAAVLPDFSSMTEEEQIAYAMQMSLAGGGQFHWPEPKGFLSRFAVFQMRNIFGLFFPTEYGEMDTGAPMDTAESAKVRHHLEEFASHPHRNLRKIGNLENKSNVIHFARL